MKRAAALLLTLSLAACATTETRLPNPATDVATIDVRRTPASAQAMDEIAAAYVRLSLEIGTHEDGYIDAYYGPADIKAAAEAAPRDKAALITATRELMARLDVAARRLSDPMERRRAAFLRAQLRAAETRLLMMQGTRFAFVDEAERLFGIRPRLRPLASYDADLAKVEALVPATARYGSGWRAISTASPSPRIGCKRCSRLQSHGVGDAVRRIFRCRRAKAFASNSSPGKAGAAIIIIRAAITA